jgi:hypothetical protein
VRSRIPALVLVVALTACTRVPEGHLSTSGQEPSSGGAGEPALPAAGDVWTIRDLPPSPAGPSPLFEVQSGFVEGVVPNSWDAQPLPDFRYPQQGFVASPHIDAWEENAGSVRGMEVFWIDIGNLRIPSDYYYLVARGPAMASLASNKDCHPSQQQVFVDNPPDLTGHRFSPGDYMASASGVCKSAEHASTTHWSYVVAAPGFGPARSVGIPTSGLYVVLAAVSGANSRGLLKELIEGARFANTPILQIVDAAAK